MAISLSHDQVRLLRLRAQRLTPKPRDMTSGVAHLVKELCGIQAQDARAATLALRVRSAGLIAADVERARVQERTIIRTWGRRGTLHLLATEDLGWLLPLLGPDRGTEPTYVLLSDWVDPGHALSQEAAFVELARRYLGAYGPATPEDMATWSGMPISSIRAAWRQIADQLMEVENGGATVWMLKTRAAWLDEPPIPARVVCLLPGFDIYLLGYQNRDLAVPRQHAKRINAGGGILHPVLLVDGRAVGIWKSQRKKNHLDVVVEPFDQLAPAVYPGLEVEVTDLARFLEVQASLHVTT